MSRARDKGALGSGRDRSAPRTRKPKTPADPATAPDGNAPGVRTNDHRKGVRSGSRNADYAVGYGSPPQASQFKPGQSGNPRGRPKGVRSEDDILAKLLNKKIPIQDRSGVRQVSVLEAIYVRVAQNALKGDLKAATFLMNRKAAVTQGRGGEAPEMNEDDRAVLDAYLAQLMTPQTKGGSK